MASVFGLPPTSVGPTPTSAPSPFSPSRTAAPTATGAIGPTGPSPVQMEPGTVQDVRQTPFAERLKEFVNQVSDEQVVAQESTTAFANGKNHDLHGTMVSLQQADISLRFLSNIRNRVIEAYREIMRMGA